MIRPYKILIKTNSKNYIVTIAIGSKILSEWLKYSFPLWKKYCLKNNLGLIVFTKNIINKNNYYWKKPTWQKMLLGDCLQKYQKNVKNICYLDTDILINPLSPNIFKYNKNQKISLISETFNMPYDLSLVRKKVAFFRNKYYSKKYPLNSSLFMTVKEKYKYHNFKPQKDYACAGVIMFNIKNFSSKMKKWFFKYTRFTKTLTGGGDEPIINYEIFKTKKVNLLDYKFQALWFYEMADKYSFLYMLKSKKTKLLKTCIEETLSNNFFLHFPGSWHEGKMWKIKNLLSDKKLNQNNIDFLKFLKKKVSRKPIGRVLPE